MATKSKKPVQNGNVDPERPGQFNLAGYVGQRMKPYQIKQVTPVPELAGSLNGALHALAQITAGIEAIENGVNLDPAVAKTLRLGQKPTAPDGLVAERTRIEAEVAALYDSFDAADLLDVRFDIIGGRRKEAINKAVRERLGAKALDLDYMLAFFEEAARIRVATDEKDRDEDADWQSLSAASWEALLDELGPSQAEILQSTCMEVVNGGMVSPDFWLRLSAYQQTLTS